MVLENFDGQDRDSKIDSFSLLVAEFFPELNAFQFMDDEAERLARIAPLVELPYLIGEQDVLSIHTDVMRPSEKMAFYSIRRENLVFRIAISLSGCDEKDNVEELTAELAKAVLHMYRNIGLRT